MVCQLQMRLSDRFRSEVEEFGIHADDEGRSRFMDATGGEAKPEKILRIPTCTDIDDLYFPNKFNLKATRSTVHVTQQLPNWIDFLFIF